MPNWCECSMAVFGDKKQLKQFFNDMTNAVSNNRKCHIENSWNNNWLGNLFYEVGYTEDQVLHNISCRGGVYHIEYLKDHVRIDYDSAWGSIEDSFNMMLKEKYPGLHQYTLAVETGMQIYYNTDTENKYLKEKYYVEFEYNNNCIYEFCTTKKEIIEFYNEIYERKYRTYKQVINDLKKQEYGSIYILMEDGAIEQS